MCVRADVRGSDSSNMDAFQESACLDSEGGPKIAGCKFKREREKKKNTQEGKKCVLSPLGTTCGTATVCPSVPAGVSEEEAGDCTDEAAKLKTFLSRTVIPPHKSARSHPLRTDKDGCSAGARKLFWLS